MKIFIKYGFFFALLCAGGYAMAQGTTSLPSSLTPSSTDQSRYYLGIIFGNVGNVLAGGGSQILGLMFGEFNRAVLILGTIIFTYVYGKGVLDTAAHGEFLGKQANSLWVPVRSIGGLALMIPKASTGYCVIQVFLMWVILQGIGAADMIWSTLASTLKDNSSGSQQSASAVISASIAMQMTGQVQNIFSSLVCGYAVQKSQNSGALMADYSTSGNSRLYNIDYYAAPGQKALSCGTISWQDSCKPTDANCQSLLTDQQNAISSIITNLQPIASFYVADAYRYCNQRDTTGACVAPAYPQSLNDSGNNGTVANDVYNYAGQINFAQNQAGNYVDSLAAAQAGQQQPIIPGQSTGNAMVDNGWIYAGSYIYDLAQSVNQSGTVPNFTASVANMSEISSYFPKNYPNPMQIASSYTQNLPSDQQSGGSQQDDPNGDKSQLLKLFDGMTAGVSVGLGTLAVITAASGLWGLTAVTGGLTSIVISFGVILHQIISNNSGPLSAILYLQTFGYIVLIIVAITFGLMLVGIFASSLATNIMNCMQPVGYATADTAAYVSSLVMALFVGLVAIGLFLAVYLPLLPFIYFTFGVLGWLVAVFETMIAAPIVALGIIHPEGHDFWGKAEPAVMLTVNVFLRPSLMLFGLMAAVLIGYVFVDIITIGFAQAMFNMHNASYMDNPLEAMAVMALYTFLIIVGYTQCFKLITETGNKVLQWIGFQGQLGASPDEAIGQMKQHGSEIGGAMQSGAQKTEGDLRQKGGAQAHREKEARSTGLGGDGSGGGGLHNGPSSAPLPPTSPQGIQNSRTGRF